MTAIRDLKPFDVVDIYIESIKREGRGIVMRLFHSGGKDGARIIGVTEAGEPFDVGISRSSAIRVRYTAPQLFSIGGKNAGTEIKTGRHENRS